MSFSHEGCQCPPEFEGDHCEYLKGMAPNTVDSNPVSLISEHVKKSTGIKLDIHQVSEGMAPNAVDSNPVSLISEHEKKSTGIKLDNHQVSNPPVLSSSGTEDLPFLTAPLPPKAESEHDSIGNSGGIFAVFLVTVLGAIGAVLLVNKKRKTQKKVRQTKRIAFFGNDECYKDETPIRVKVMSEIETEKGMKLDDLLGDLNKVEEEDEDEGSLVGSISEMTLEEIELESDDRFV